MIAQVVRPSKFWVFRTMCFAYGQHWQLFNGAARSCFFQCRRKVKALQGECMKWYSTSAMRLSLRSTGAYLTSTLLAEIGSAVPFDAALGTTRCLAAVGWQQLFYKCRLHCIAFAFLQTLYQLHKG